jgi:ABC-type transport system involved in multi-copper enzyme maturation permease subunit
MKNSFGPAMKHSFRAEWLKLMRPSIILGVGGTLVLLACLASVLTFAAASEDVGPPPLNNPPLLSTTGELATQSGISRGFVIAAGFIGILVLVLFAASVAGEFTQGTLRVLLTRQPRRAPLLLGKLSALLVACAIALAAAIALSIAFSFGLAAMRGISTADWVTSAGAGEVARAYGDTLLAVALFAILGTSIGLITRSTVAAIAVGVAWLMPLEHIVQGIWAQAGGWFPGLVIDAIIREGTDVAPYGRSIGLGLVYAGTFAVVGAAMFLRRDVTT